MSFMWGFSGLQAVFVLLLNAASVCRIRNSFSWCCACQTALGKMTESGAGTAPNPTPDWKPDIQADVTQSSAHSAPPAEAPEECGECCALKRHVKAWHRGSCSLQSRPTVPSAALQLQQNHQHHGMLPYSNLLLFCLFKCKTDMSLNLSAMLLSISHCRDLVFDSFDCMCAFVKIFAQLLGK